MSDAMISMYNDLRHARPAIYTPGFSDWRDAMAQTLAALPVAQRWACMTLLANDIASISDMPLGAAFAWVVGMVGEESHEPR